MNTLDSCVVRRVCIPDALATPPQAGQTVLLVTEDVNLREACGRALVAAGYSVVEAAHSGHALLASLRGGAIDIILTELSMGDISGPNLAERVRRHHPALRAAYLANAGTPECDGVIVRPFTRDDVLRQLTVISREPAAVS